MQALAAFVSCWLAKPIGVLHLANGEAGICIFAEQPKICGTKQNGPHR
jgi:hypothetical protein